MTNELKNKINVELKNLPSDIQEAVNSVDWVDTLGEIGKNHLLVEKEVEILQIETFLVILGMVNEETYITNIEDRAGTTKKESVLIFEDVLSQIFSPMARAYEEIIKKSSSSKNSKWDQNVDFFMSGGDYTTLKQQGVKQNDNKNLEEVKKKFTI